MKFGKVLRVLCLLMVCSLLLTSCTLFRRNKNENSPQEDNVEDTENTEDTNKEDEKDPSSNGGETPAPVVPDPTPEELIADMMPYDFNKATITVAVPEDCAMFDQGTDPNAVLIPHVYELTDEICSLGGEAGSELGTGGMYTKLRPRELLSAAAVTWS